MAQRCVTSQRKITALTSRSVKLFRPRLVLESRHWIFSQTLEQLIVHFPNDWQDYSFDPIHLVELENDQILKFPNCPLIQLEPLVHHPCHL